MNEGTSKFLLNWINANASDTELVRDIRDPSCKSLLLKILYLVDKDTGKDLPCERDFDLVQVLSLVISYLGGFHRQNFTTIITDEKIRNKDELEIGKVITLLLCAATQCDNVATFVNQITKLSIEDQFHFKFLIESVLTEMDEGSLTAESFETILRKQVDLSFGENHSVELNGSFSSPITVQSPVEALFTNSPLKSLVASPQFRSRQNQLMLNKLQQKVIKLQATLDSQMHLQTELESELTEKNKEIDARDSSILELRKEVAKLMSAADEIELMRHFKEECGRAEKENSRLKQKVFELQTFKQQCGDLEGKVAAFVQEKEQFEKEQVEAGRLKSSIERYKTKVHQMEFKTSELEAALSRKEQVILKLEKEMEEIVCSATKSAEMIREMPRIHPVEIDDVLLEGVTEDGFPNLITTKAPLNMDSRIIELELEKDRLTSRLSNCVNQEEFLALKETLAFTQEAHSSYKENYIAAKSKILELEEEFTKNLVEKTKQIQTLELERDQLDSKVESMKQDKAATTKKLTELQKTCESYALKAKALEASAEQMRKDAESDKESLRHQMQEQLNKRDCEIDLTRKELENLKRDYSELEQRQTGKMAKVLVEETDKCQGLFEEIRELETTNEEKGKKLQKTCESYVLEARTLEVNAEQLRKDAESEKESLRHQMQEQLNKRDSEIDLTRKELEKLKKDYSELEQRQTGEMAKVLVEERNKYQGLFEEIRELETTNEEKGKKLQKTCESYVLEARTLEVNAEQLRKDAESEKESLRHQMQEQLNKRESEIDLTRKELEKLKTDYSELEQRQTGEMAKVLVEERNKCQGLFEEIRELETTNEEKGKEIENLKALLKTSVEENEKAVATLESSRVDWNNKEQQLLKKVEELEGTVSTMEEMRNAFAEMEGKLGEIEALKERLEEKVEEESLINRRLGTEINSLEAQLCHADQQIRKQRQEFENKSKADSAGRKMIAGIKSQLYHGPPLAEEDTFNESDESLPLQLEDFSGCTKGPINTEDLSLLSESNQSLSTSCHSVCSSNFRANAQTRTSRRQSAIYLRGNTPPENRTTNSAAFFILGGGLGIAPECDDEVDWDRLAELQRRNASCLPHLQTSYPIETQMQPELTGETGVLKTDGISMDAPTMNPYNTRKRKSEDKATSMSISKPSSSQTLPKSKSASNVTPGKRITSRRIAAALGLLRSRSNENLTSQDSDISARRESIAYEIDISPPKKAKANISRRRTIARYTGTSHLLGEKNKVSSKKTSSRSLQTSTGQERKPLKNLQLKK